MDKQESGISIPITDPAHNDGAQLEAKPAEDAREVPEDEESDVEFNFPDDMEDEDLNADLVVATVPDIQPAMQVADPTQSS